MAQQSGSGTPQVERNEFQVVQIRSAADAALKFAFRAIPVRILGINESQPTNMVEVSGREYCDGPGSCPCGLTAPNRKASTVWYGCNESNAQWALNLQGTDLSAATASKSFSDVVQATGRGIGNTAAHEIAHQFLENSFSCAMNDDLSKTGVYDGGNAKDPSMYTGLGPGRQPLHWSTNTGLCLFNKILWNTVRQ